MSHRPTTQFNDYRASSDNFGDAISKLLQNIDFRICKVVLLQICDLALVSRNGPLPVTLALTSSKIWRPRSSYSRSVGNALSPLSGLREVVISSFKLSSTASWRMSIMSTSVSLLNSRSFGAGDVLSEFTTSISPGSSALFETLGIVIL